MARTKSEFLSNWPIKAAITALWVALAWTSRADTFQVSDIAGGVNDASPANLIGDNEASSISNFHVNPITHGLDQRRGSSKQNATQLSGNVAVDIFSHVKSDGTSYLISVASRTVSYSTSNGATWTTLVTTMTNGAVWDFSSFVDDKSYGVNQNDGGWAFDGVSFSSIAAGGMPAAKFLEPYQNRLFAANTASFPYRVFFSGLLQASTWTTSTDYFDMPESVVGIGQAFDGGLPIYTANSVWMLRGSSPNDFYLQQVSGNIGAADNRDIKNFEIDGTEYQVFLSLGPNRSRNTIYGLLGNRLVDLGAKVPNLLSGVAIFDSSSRQFSWDVVADFLNGISSQTYVNSASESVKLSTSSDTDTSGSDFAAGSLSVGLTTSAVSGQLTFSTFLNNSAENGSDGFLPTAWIRSGNSSDLSGLYWATTSLSPRTGSRSFGITFNGSMGTSCSSGSDDLIGVSIVDSNNNSLISNDLYRPSTTWTQRTLSMAGITNQLVKVRLNRQNTYITYSNSFYSDGGSITYYDIEDSSGCSGGSVDSKIDDFGGSVVLGAAISTSSTFDTTFSTAAMFESGANWAANGSLISAQTQESSDGSSWDSAVAWSTGSAPSSSARKRYKRYVLSFTTTTASTAMPYVNDVTLNARVATGTFTSEMRDGGSTISSWDILSANSSGGGVSAYSYRTGASTTAVAASAWTSIASGADVSGSAEFIQWKDDFTIVQSTDDPTLNALTINYSQSSGASQPGDMEVWNQDLWMTYTSTSSSYNSSIILMNNQGRFSTLSGLTVYGFVTHSRLLLAGTSLNDGVSGGYVRRLDVGTTDDGTAVTSSVVFKAQEFPGDYQDWIKNISGMYFNYAVNLGTFTSTINENFSDHTQSRSVNATLGNTIGRYQFQASPGTSAKQISLAFSNSYPGARLRLYPPFTYYFSKQKVIPPQ